VKQGGYLWSNLFSLGTKMLPMATNLASKVLPGLATGALGSIGNFTMDKILGQGISQTGGLLISDSKIQQLI